MADAMEGLTPEEKAAFEEAEQKTRERYELARKVVDLAEGLVVSDSHFLAPAIGQLKSDISPALMIEPFATDGQTLYIEPTRVLATFAKTRKPPIHDIVHVLMHCILMHPFVDDRVERFPGTLPLTSSPRAWPPRSAAPVKGTGARPSRSCSST